MITITLDDNNPKLIKALKEDHNPSEQIEWAKQYNWSSVAQSWKEAIDA
jgi:hypothetical protein